MNKGILETSIYQIFSMFQLLFWGSNINSIVYFCHIYNSMVSSYHKTHQILKKYLVNDFQMNLSKVTQ